MGVPTLKNLLEEGVSGRGVLVRSDFNVPLDGSTITDPGRILASLPTLNALIDAGAKVIITAHLGRPKGEPDPKFSLAPVAARLSEELGRNVQLAGDVVGTDALARAEGLTEGDVLLLENIRFDPRETSKDDAEREKLAKALVELVGEDGAFVSDGFGVVHRKQASVYDVAKLLPHYAGELVAAEVEVLSKLTEDPARPYAVVLGGSKVSDKLGVIEALAPKVDTLVIGGGMAFTFLAAQGAAHDQVCCYNEIAQFDQIVADTEIRVVLVDFTTQQANAMLRTLQAFGGTHNPDIVPHEAAQFCPVV